MREKSLPSHLLISILISGIPYALFMFFRDNFPNVFPDRDNLSAYTHLLAVIIIGYRFLRLGNYRKNWLYIPVLLLAGFMFIEESEFLSEITFFGKSLYYQYRPAFVIPYLEKYGLEEQRWRSFHNFFYFFFTQWSKEYYDGELVKLIFRENLRIFVLSLGFILIQRLANKKDSRKERSADQFSAMAVLIGLYGIWRLVAPQQIPDFEKSENLRVVAIVFLFILSILPLLFSIRRKGNKGDASAFTKRLNRLVKKKAATYIWIAALLLAATLATIGQFYVSRFQFEASRLVSEILIVFVATLIGFMLLGLLLLSGGRGFYRWPMREYWERLRAFLLDKPSFIYVAAYIAIIVLAQLFDWNVLSREGLRYVREEVIEWVGAFQLIMAGLMIPSGQEKT